MLESGATCVPAPGPGPAPASAIGSAVSPTAAPTTLPGGYLSSPAPGYPPFDQPGQTQPYPYGSQSATGYPVGNSPAEKPLTVESTTRERPRKKGLLVGGLTTLVGTYLFSAWVGVQLLTYEDRHSDRTCSNCNTTGGALMVPILGPWIALPNANKDKGGQLICAVLGAAQATGVVLTIVGIMRYGSSAQTDTTTAGRGPLRSLTVGVAPLPGGGASGTLGASF